MTKLQIVSTMAGAVMLAGCSTVDPRTVPQTSRDMETYTPTAQRPAPEGQYKIAISSKMLNKPSAITPDMKKVMDGNVNGYTEEQLEGIKEDINALSREAELFPYVPEQVEISLAQNFHNLGWFETVDRSHGMALAGEAALAGDKEALDLGKYSKADLVLFAESHLTWVAPQGWKTTSNAGKARGAIVKTNFRLIEVASKQPILVKQITTKIADNGKGRGLLKEAIQKCCDQNAAKFSRIVAAKFLPEVRVKETRGSGRYALVAMGQNSQAKPQTSSWKWWPYVYLPLCYIKTVDVPGTRIDFCYTEKEKGPGGKDAYESVNFAYGEVISSDAKTAWVEVVNPDTAGVKKGHSAVVSDRTLDGQELQ